MRHSGVGTSEWSATRHKRNRIVIIVQFSNLPRSRSYELDLPGAGHLYQSEKVNRVRNNGHVVVRFRGFLVWCVLRCHPYRPITILELLWCERWYSSSFGRWRVNS